LSGDASRLRIEKLASTHDTADFNCSEPALNQFLVRHALQGQNAGSSTTYVALHNEKVVGFYTLSVGQVAHAEAPERLKKGMPRHPVPIMLLARLAVITDWRGQGVGGGLLKDAMRRTLQAADIAGIRAFVVHAKDDQARAFYEHFNFIPSPSDPYHLFVLVKDVRRLLR